MTVFEISRLSSASSDHFPATADMGHATLSLHDRRCRRSGVSRKAASLPVRTSTNADLGGAASSCENNAPCGHNGPTYILVGYANQTGTYHLRLRIPKNVSYFGAGTPS